jgi:hypothetical protein
MKGVPFRRVNHAELKLFPWAKVRGLGGRIFWPKAVISVRCRSLGIKIPVRDRVRSGRYKAKCRYFTSFCYHAAGFILIPSWLLGRRARPRRGGRAGRSGGLAISPPGTARIRSQNLIILFCYGVCWIPVALRPAPIPPCFTSGPPGASCIARVPSGPSGVSLDPPVCPPVPLVSLGFYSSIVVAQL